MEMTSGILSPEVLASEFEAAQPILVGLNVHSLVVMFGWGCDIDHPKIWKDFEIQTKDLSAFLRRHSNDLAFKFGSADFVIGSASPRFELKFCHEADIHLKTDDHSVFSTFESLWKERRFAGYSMTNGAWTPWGNDA